LSVGRSCDAVECTCQEVTHSRLRGAWVASTGSFVVHSFRSAKEAEHTARHCEALRRDLVKLYAFETGKGKWQPKCNVFLFPDKSKYGAVVGRPAQESLGSSLVTPPTGDIVGRRIDLRTDVTDFQNEVLPHELTHVLIADHFRDGPPPLWYDEGLALLADSQTKQALHFRDLRHGLDRGQAFSLQSLLSTTQYPSPEKTSIFYGQCASMARYLSKHAGTSKIHEFARRSQEVGANLALEETYGVHGVAELERMWRASLARSPQVIPARFSHKVNSR
jgi:hypothetical protein